MELTLSGQALDGNNIFALDLFDLELAGESRFFVYENGAGAAKPYLTAAFRPRELEVPS
jgi:hypothetical protein